MSQCVLGDTPLIFSHKKPSAVVSFLYQSMGMGMRQQYFIHSKQAETSRGFPAVHTGTVVERAEQYCTEREVLSLLVS